MSVPSANSLPAAASCMKSYRRSRACRQRSTSIPRSAASLRAGSEKSPGAPPRIRVSSGELRSLHHMTPSMEWLRT